MDTSWLPGPSRHRTPCAPPSPWSPGRLVEMQRTKDDAFAKAVEWQSLSPVRSWVLAWARDIEIARRPDLAARHARAEDNLEHEDPAVARAALQELTEVLDEALRAVRT